MPAAVLLRTIVASSCASTSDAFSPAGSLSVCSVLSMVVVGRGMFFRVEDEDEEEEPRATGERREIELYKVK